ncbi:MAG: TadE/TadG family type IV pilus assembly protein [Pseudomonadota bacterium]
MRHFAPTMRRRQRGATAVEFALCSIIFFTFVFGVIELARALYMWNSMIEVTRRAARGAAAADFSDAAQMSQVRHRAMFGDIPGGLPLRGSVTEDNLAIDYLNGNLARVDPLPVCPEENLINCATDPDGASCIRFVRVRLCSASAGASCTPVDYDPIISANFFPGAPLQYPTFATVTPVATLGHQPGAAGTCM